MEDIVVFLGVKVFNSDISYRLKIISHQNYGHWYLVYAFKGTVVNRALQSLHGELLEITRIVPLNLKDLLDSQTIYLNTCILDEILIEVDVKGAREGVGGAEGMDNSSARTTPTSSTRRGEGVAGGVEGWFRVVDWLIRLVRGGLGLILGVKGLILGVKGLD